MSKQARGMIQFRLIPHPKKSGTLFAHINFTPRFLSLDPFFARPVPTTAPRPSLLREQATQELGGRQFPFLPQCNTTKMLP